MAYNIDKLDKAVNSALRDLTLSEEKRQVLLRRCLDAEYIEANDRHPKPKPLWRKPVVIALASAAAALAVFAGLKGVLKKSGSGEELQMAEAQNSIESKAFVDGAESEFYSSSYDVDVTAEEESIEKTGESPQKIQESQESFDETQETEETQEAVIENYDEALEPALPNSAGNYDEALEPALPRVAEDGMGNEAGVAGRAVSPMMGAAARLDESDESAEENFNDEVTAEESVGVAENSTKQDGAKSGGSASSASENGNILRYSSLAEASAEGYVPLLPKNMPADFELNFVEVLPYTSDIRMNFGSNIDESYLIIAVSKEEPTNWDKSKAVLSSLNGTDLYVESYDGDKNSALITAVWQDIDSNWNELTLYRQNDGSAAMDEVLSMIDSIMKAR